MARAYNEAPRTNISKRAVQWSDLSRQGQDVVSQQFRNMGSNISEIATDSAERLHKAAANTKDDSKARMLTGRAQGIESIIPHLKDKPVTLRTAANSRVRRYDAATAAASDRGESMPAGAGWYFNHHADLAAAAKQHGFDVDRVTVGSATMSPQNSPENEKAATVALMDTLRNRSVHVSSDVATHLAKNGIPVDPAHVGQRVAFSELHPHAAAALSDAKFRGKVDTDADLKSVSRGGTKGNIKKAIDVLTGVTHPDDAIDPHTAPKVHSYAQNIRTAVPNTAEHVEYMTRVRHHSLIAKGEIHRDQGTLDLYGLEKSRNGLLNPEGGTAEDTWQNAETFDQPNKNVGTGRTNVLKTAGSMDATYGSGTKKRGPDPRWKGDPSETPTVSADPRKEVTSQGLHHAFNNKATHLAAATITNRSDAHLALPAVAAQEIPWTQVRREAGKDPEYAAHQRSTEKQSVADRLVNSRQIKGQGELF